jgi:hypothetical protein
MNTYTLLLPTYMANITHYTNRFSLQNIFANIYIGRAFGYVEIQIGFIIRIFKFM